MDYNRIRTTAEIEVSKQLQSAFLADMRNMQAGMTKQDQRQMDPLISEVESKSPAQWSAETKQEFIRFIVCRAELYIQNN